ncbi:MAG: hypothetical protein H6922_05010 [Pseudomonadaceae bacterium]|nr:hypothetical protein [Pseudomonadaceae bacterium]
MGRADDVISRFQQKAAGGAFKNSTPQELQEAKIKDRAALMPDNAFPKSNEEALAQERFLRDAELEIIRKTAHAMGYRLVKDSSQEPEER